MRLTSAGSGGAAGEHRRCREPLRLRRLVWVLCADGPDVVLDDGRSGGREGQIAGSITRHWCMCMSSQLREAQSVSGLAAFLSQYHGAPVKRRAPAKVREGKSGLSIATISRAEY